MNDSPKAKPTRAGIITTKVHVRSPFLTAPLPGTSFATLAVALADARKQLVVPQLYPLGQHPADAPASEGQSDHPPAQVPVVVVAGTSLAGTTTVTPLETMVDEAVDGHEVVWQSRPVWQQPPPYTAEQA